MVTQEAAAPPPPLPRGGGGGGGGCRRRRARSFVLLGPLALALLALTVAPARPADAHGTLLQPRSRNFLAYLKGNEYYAHGLSAGGAGVMSDGGRLQWPAMRLEGICGGAPGNKHWDAPGAEPAATYALGSTISVDAVITVNHLGRARVRLCPLDAKRADGGDGCVDLERADGKGTLWYLPFVAGWAGGTYGDRPPLYGDGFYEAYPLPSITAKEGCDGGVYCDAYKGMVVYRTKWRLPANFTGATSSSGGGGGGGGGRAKLAWEWMTAHSCWPPCPSQLENEPTCADAQVYAQCGTKGASYPEYFYNCADVKLVPAAAASGGQQPPPPPPQQPLWPADVSRWPAKQWGTPVVVRMNDPSPPAPYKPASGKPPFAPGPKPPKQPRGDSTPPPPPPPPDDNGDDPSVQPFSGPAPPPPFPSSWDDAPVCYKTSVQHSRADPRDALAAELAAALDRQQHRWGFEDGRACRYVAGVSDRDAEALAARAAADAEAAKAPRCEGAPAAAATVVDDEGRVWGFEQGRSCLVVAVAPPPPPAAAAAAAPTVAAEEGRDDHPAETPVALDAPPPLSSPTPNPDASPSPPLSPSASPPSSSSTNK
jgi:hypothetical protein